ncbi:MAG: hypothetical protein HN351_01660 [Deltaproteobacteria bacterium]|jgi:hypothetical protein|nr:hypothetical protein [Deltaproteobacteria bacterium]
MQLVGIGFASSNWDSLVKQLQKQLPHQLNGKLFVDSVSATAAEISSKEFEYASAELKKLNADWVLFSPGAFETPEVCFKLLEELKNNSAKNVNYVLVLDDLSHDLSALLKLQPVLELVNKMQFRLSAPEMLLTHHIRSFPRIRLDNDFQTIDYTNHFGILVRQSASDVPLNTLIPLNNIQKFETENGDLAPEIWLQKFLGKQGKPALPERAVGILREAKGCYLFPGIPFNSIQRLNFENIKVEHLIRLDECTLKNPPFKRFIEQMKGEHKRWQKEHQQNKNIKAAVHGSGKYLIVNALLEKLFSEIGWTNVKLQTNTDSTLLPQKDTVYWLKLDESPEIKSKLCLIDWSADLQQILAALEDFVELNDLQIAENSAVLPIQKAEFVKMREYLLTEEKALESTIHQAESSQMLYEQERDVLQNINAFSKILIAALSKSTTWEDAAENAAEAKMSKALLLCEEENIAAELNLKLSKVQRKLWINPFKFQQPEDLTQFNTKMILSYLKPKNLIVTAAARAHLENLCRQAIEQGEKAETVFNEQNKIIEHAKTDAALLMKNKNNLALRWLHVSLKQLLYRDRHLFQTLPEKAA